jgi:redox-sensitive bicupin YhaK (pirin superfamily)
MFDLPHELEAGEGARVTVRSAAARALILEVRLPSTAAAAWFSALTRYGRRLEVLRGTLLVDGDALRAGERTMVAPGRKLTVSAGSEEEAHFLCELQPAGGRAELVTALQASLSPVAGLDSIERP